ncbi:helix-turn-helix transcriptional regulator [Pseudonocardia abyssalis]|uniref:WYL domain-containing protein n=1 Tax=Pseudonocardia abyssalis TaxID=2792008 RepID=A0ABS6UUA7_9PSEU|nr:WYL domain-containing protein [Pseudonocardia abyssalis]MBW0116262.1 WYL domain-containing protein [Pseudonocardia abyssalis]MBW0135850.1 WYL domain-containing protein [Pseudonocardia abyssalis]
MRASRLVTLLFTLQRRRAATAAELAAELEVSERTIYRDVAALADAGVPLFTESGPGGGIRLVDGWRTRLDGLTAHEAAALFAVGAPQVLADLGMSAALAGAQAKLLATLPESLREHARTVAERFHLDAPGWFHRPHEVPHLDTVAAAVWEQQRLRIGYRRRDEVVQRELDPLGLVMKAGTWYLSADSGGRVLMFRVDRIVDAEPTGERFVRPPDFDLPTWWAGASAGFESTMLRATVRLRLGPGALTRLPRVVDADAAATALTNAGDPDTDGWREVRLDVEDVRVAAGQLVGLAGEVEALDPPELRSALRAAGLALAAHNTGTG